MTPYLTSPCYMFSLHIIFLITYHPYNHIRLFFIIPLIGSTCPYVTLSTRLVKIARFPGANGMQLVENSQQSWYIQRQIVVHCDIKTSHCLLGDGRYIKTSLPQTNCFTASSCCGRRLNTQALQHSPLNGFF